MKAAIVFGTRPEIIKLSHVVKLAAGTPGVELEIIHTGQHYSYNLSERFLEDLDLPRIEIDIAVGSLERLDQIRRIVHGLEPLLENAHPDVVVVQGDTNSALAGAIAGRLAGIPVAHVEAGLRCFDPVMIEEINRIAVDRIADICFAPTERACRNMAAEGLDAGKVHLVGNTIVEVATENLAIAEGHSSILGELGLQPEAYVLVTAHRQKNVDDADRLADLVSAFEKIDLPMVYPVHPRTLERMVEFELLHRLEAIERLQLTDPLPYFDFLALSRSSRMIISDSGGIQEECTIFKKPIVIVRDCTERQEILGTFGTITGSDPDAVLAEVRRIDSGYDEIMEGLRALDTPFGDGRASERILQTLMDSPLLQES